MYKHYSQSISSWVRISSTLSVLLILALVILPSTFAQSTTEGAIGGTVYDPNGAVVPGAKVTAHNNGTNAEKSVNTDNSGYYRITQLQPGSYTVTVTPTGFAPFKSENVIVQVGSVTEISPRLAVAGTQESVQVTSEVPQVNSTSPELAQTLNQTDVTNLPINGGRWSNFAALTPGVVHNSSGFGLLSFRGISALLNNNTVDGADNNQAFFSEERGRTRAGYSTPKVAIQEFQVNTSNYSAEYGRAAGGVINTVTKSGTNSLHGEAYFYDRDNGWGATNPFSKFQRPDASGGFTPVPFKPKDWRKITGIGVGGPVIKDKLFWFLTFDYYLRNFPGFAVASSPATFFATQTTASANIDTLARRLNGLPATGAPAPTAAQLNQALTTWNNDLAALNTMLGPVPRTGEQFLLLPKIDWMVNQKNHASFTFNRMRWASPAGIQTQGTNTFGIASFGNDFVKTTWGVGKLDTLITNNLTNEARYQYGRDFEFENNQTPTPYEQNTLLHPAGYTNPLGLPPQVAITNGFTFGTANFLLRAKYPDETRQQFADTVSWTHGNHNFKFGTDYNHVHVEAQNLRNQFGSYSYSSLLNYISDLHTTRRCTAGTPAVPAPCYSSFTQAFGTLAFRFNTNEIAFFATDDWKVLPRLNLSLGLRYDYEMLPSPYSNLINPSIPQTAHMPSDKNNIAPRLGFAYDIFGDGKTVLRGGYGIFFGRIINSTIYNALISTAMPGAQFSYNFSASATSPLFPTILAAQPTSLSAPPAVIFFDRHFQNPQIHQMDLTLEHNLGWNTVLSVSYLGSLGRELPGFADLNINPSTSTVTYRVLNGGPLNRATYTTPLFSTRPNGAFSSMTDIFSGINSKYQALSTRLDHRLSHHIQFAVNYTWAHSLDFNQNEQTFTSTNDLLTPGNLRGEYANSIYDVRHRLVISAVANSPWKKNGWLGYFTNDWQLSPIFQMQTGLPYTLATSGSAPGGLQFGGGGINGSGGVFRIDATGRNTFRMPTTYVQDLRLSKSFTFQERYKLELLASVFNLANHTNVTGVSTTGYSIVTSGTVSTPAGNVACSTGSPCLNYNVNSTTFAPVFGTVTSANSNFAYSPRQLELGVRVTF